jgi:hypothetical protein
MGTRFSHLNFALRNKKTFQQLESMGIKTLGAVKKNSGTSAVESVGKIRKSPD